jgi:hypothetical protein
MKHKLFLTLLFPFLVFSQNKNQNCTCELAEELRPKIGFHFNQGNFDSAAYYTNQLKAEKTPICDVMYYNAFTQIATGQKDYLSARNYLKAEAKILSKFDCPERLSRHYTNYSLLYQFLNKHDSAVYVALKGLDYAEIAKDTLTQIRLCGNIGAFFDQLKQYDKAIYYEKIGLELARKTNNSYYLAGLLVNSANSYLTLFENSKNEKYLDSLIVLAEEGLRAAFESNALIHALDAYGIISQYYFNKKDFNKAINYADSVILTAPKGANFFNLNLQGAFTSKSHIYLEQKEYLKAKQNADSALYYGNLFNVQATIKPLELLYKSSKELGDYNTALSSFERMTHLKDSMFNLEKNEAIAELEKKYNQAKNEKTIKELSQEAEIKNLRIRVLIGFVVIALILILVIIIVFRQRTLKNKQIILETEQRLNRSRINPHFFFNAITTLQGIAVKENDGKKVALNLYKFSSLMRKTLESSYNDYITVDEELEFINQYIELQKLKENNSFNFEVELQNELESDALLLPSMLIQPFLENSIEHGFSNIDYKGLLQLNIKEENQKLIINIVDNGVGLKSKSETTNKHISRATQITKDRLYLLKKEKNVDCDFSVLANETKGVTVQISLPLLYK